MKTNIFAASVLQFFSHQILAHPIWCTSPATTNSSSSAAASLQNSTHRAVLPSPLYRLLQLINTADFSISISLDLLIEIRSNWIHLTISQFHEQQLFSISDLSQWSVSPKSASRGNELNSDVDSKWIPSNYLMQPIRKGSVS